MHTAYSPPKKRLNRKLGKYVIHLILIGVSFLLLVPTILVVSVSLSDEIALIKEGYSLLPRHFSTVAYRYILTNPSQLIRAYGVTTVVTIVGTLGGVLVASLLAYPLSRQRFKLRSVLSFYVFFTMLFSGGLIPTYIVISSVLGLRNNLLALILPILVNPWFVLILRTYFSQIPEELIDAARIDGAGEWRLFFQIVMPLSKPALATIGLFYVLAYWNDWFQALLYIDNPNLYPLQYLLYSIITNIQALAENPFFASELAIVPAQTVRMAMAVLVAGPAVFVFLLAQKHFVRGLTIGGLKG